MGLYGDNAMKPSILFSSFYSRYKAYRSHHVREASLAHAEAVRNHYFLHLDKTPINVAFSKRNIQSIYNKILSDESFSPSWKNRMFGVLRRFLDAAGKWGYLSLSETTKAKATLENIPENRRIKERPCWNKEQTHRFLSVIDDQDDRLMFSLFIELGARLSEFLALSWQAYDSRKGSLAILAQLKGNSKKRQVVSPLLKTKESYRVCKISPAMKEALNKRKQSSLSSYLFHDPGNPRDPYPKALFRKRFEKYIALAKLPRITPHAVRHAKATALVKACRNMLEIKAVARYLGHSVSMLLDVYAHEEEKTLEAVLRRCQS